MDQHQFHTSITGKIIIAFLISAVALSGAYFVYKLAFREILFATEKLNVPNQKLHIVNKLFNELATSGQLFKQVVTNDNQDIYQKFIQHTDSISASLDTLQNLCRDNTRQFELLAGIHEAMDERENVLLNYIRFRYERQRNNQVSKQLLMLDSLLSNFGGFADSLMVPTEERKVITKEVTSVTEEVKNRKGFLGGLFKRPEKKVTSSDTIVREEIVTRPETQLAARPDSLLNMAKELITGITQHQQARRKDFLQREASLAEFEKEFNSKVMGILLEVEREVIDQAQATHSASETVIGRSIKKINLILLFFFVLTGLIIFLILTDVTRSSKYRRQLEKAHAEAEFHSMARQRFLSNMSHEIRTPLQSIIGFSEQALLRDLPSKEEIQAIYRSSEHLLQVVNEILDYSRITSGKFSFEKSPFRLKPILTEVIDMVRPQVETKGLSLVYSSSVSEQRIVIGDAFRLKQILLNLLGNAIKFTDRGQVMLEVSEEQEKSDSPISNFKFKVSDTGMGIPTDMQQRVFEQFEQATLPNNPQFRGTGLGLNITKSLVEEQGGSISLESEPGIGSTFSFTIPYEMQEVAIPAQSTLSVSPVSSIGEVWVVDDDHLILQLCSVIFSRHHIPHSCFETGGALLDELRHRQPSIILTDIRLPVINGFDLIKYIRNTLASPPHLIALTAQALPEEREQILKGGFDDLVMKPFREADLLAAVQIATTDLPQNSLVPKGHRINLDNLRRMISDDPAELKAILQQFVSDTTQDLYLLQQFTNSDDAVGAVDILHRLAGRTAQIGASEHGARLRKLEIEYRSHPDQVSRLMESIAEIKQLIQTLEGQLERDEIA